MKAEIKAAWIAALRSGEYEQVASALRVKDRFCCLGVLCDLASKQGVGEWLDTDKAFIADTGDSKTDYLPYAIQEWAGLSDGDPLVVGGSLAEHNDGTGSVEHAHTFTEIADLIEQHL